MRVHFEERYDAVASLDSTRVVWTHPEAGLTDELLAIGRRSARSEVHLFDTLLDRLTTGL